MGKHSKKNKPTKDLDIKSLAIQALVDLAVGTLVAIIAKHII